MARLTNNELGRIAQAILVAGGSPSKIPAAINRIMSVLEPGEDPVMPDSLKIATFVSKFDDGSSFSSPCIVDEDNLAVVYIANAGSAAEDAMCIEQYVEMPDYRTRRVIDANEMSPEECADENVYTIE